MLHLYHSEVNVYKPRILCRSLEIVTRQDYLLSFSSLAPPLRYCLWHFLLFWGQFRCPIMPSQTNAGVSVIIIGGGFSGVAMACQLRMRSRLESYCIYDQIDGIGGTWRANTCTSLSTKRLGEISMT